MSDHDGKGFLCVGSVQVSEERGHKTREEEEMSAPGKTERSWYLNPDTADALRFARLCVPKGTRYSEIIALSTSLLFNEIQKISDEEGVSVGRAVRMLFENIGEKDLTISITISPGKGQTVSEISSETHKEESQ